MPDQTDAERLATIREVHAACLPEDCDAAWLLARQREALEWYAEENLVHDDAGERARAALGQPKPKEAKRG